MFEKGRGNNHKELLVIYSADTIRLGSCYCCNNLGQKSAACCTFFVNIPLLSHRLCHIFVLCPSFTVPLRPSPYPIPEAIWNHWKWPHRKTGRNVPELGLKGGTKYAHFDIDTVCASTLVNIQKWDLPHRKKP